MVRAGRSFSQPVIPRNVANNNNTIDSNGASFSIDNPAIQDSSVSKSSVDTGGATSNAFDVVALLAAVGAEQMQYIEFNCVHREHETRQRWPLLHRVSELLDPPEKSSDVTKSVVLHKDGVAI